jgi:hypothetical protein
MVFQSLGLGSSTAIVHLLPSTFLRLLPWYESRAVVAVIVAKGRVMFRFVRPRQLANAHWSTGGGSCPIDAQSKCHVDVFDRLTRCKPARSIAGSHKVEWLSHRPGHGGGSLAGWRSLAARPPRCVQWAGGLR